MGVEVTRKKNGPLSSKWWYGRFTGDGKSKCVNLGIKVAGTEKLETLRLSGRGCLM